ncbi:MAG: hypothetical protein ACRDAG_10015 [Cetobacterium somerae]|uniref:hypothetical protein n=2 Tax=Cetobacterium somerae TaxID=188913 RepID=UPI00389190CB
MKKVLIIMFLILSNYIFSSEINGQIYNLEKRGASYRGSLDARIFSHKKEIRIKINPDKNIEILRVNGNKNENNIYIINNETMRVDFIYKSKINSVNDQIILGRVDYLNEVGKNEVLVGNIAVDFRKIGKIDMNVKGEMDFGTINPRVPSGGISSKKNPEITIDLDIDKKDVGNTKMYFEYPNQIVMANGQLIIKLESKDKSNFVSETTQGGEKFRVLGFIPNKEKTKEKIRIQGRLFSTVPIVKAGEYKESVRVKAFYEYLDYSIENKNPNKKVVIRR